MEIVSPSQKDIMIAWATPVQVTQLGARLEAYAETKSAITTFRLAASHTMLAGHRSLPQEIVSTITSMVRDHAYKLKRKEWTKLSKCLANTCTAFSHMDEARIRSMREFKSFRECDCCNDEDGIPDDYMCEARDAHESEVEEYCHRLTKLDGFTKFAK